MAGCRRACRRRLPARTHPLLPSPPLPTPRAAVEGQSACQEECLLNAACVAYMWAPDADEPCQERSPEQQALRDTQGLVCPEKPLLGCKPNYCILLSGYYEVVEYDAKGRSHPGARACVPRKPARKGLQGRAGAGPVTAARRACSAAPSPPPAHTCHARVHARRRGCWPACCADVRIGAVPTPACHAGNMVGAIPGRVNPHAGPTPPGGGVLAVDPGSAYEGKTPDGSGLTKPQLAGYSLPSLSFDFKGAAPDSRCDADGNCAINGPCELFTTTGAPPRLPAWVGALRASHLPRPPRTRPARVSGGALTSPLPCTPTPPPAALLQPRPARTCAFR